MEFSENDETSSFILHPSSFDIGKRFDAFLVEKIENWSRSRLQRLIDDGDATVNGNPAKSSYKLRADDEIEIELTELPDETFEPEEIALEIVYEDDALAVINKPAGMVVHPGAGVRNGTLANAIAFHFNLQTSNPEPASESDLGFGISDFGLTSTQTTNPKSEIPNPKSNGGTDSPEKIPNPKSQIANRKSQIANRIGIVHRLDKDTSGLIVVAKNEDIHEKLSEQFREREVFKSYVALVHGEISANSGTIDQPIAREKHNRTKMTIRKHGRNAVSLWKVRKRFEKFTLLNVEIKTGRTHQIRVHLTSINHPVVGDETYNSGRDKTVKDLTVRQVIADLNRFFLHAERLSFTHPQTLEKLEFYVPLPPELKNLIEII